MLNRMKNRVLDLIVAPDLPALPSSSGGHSSSSQPFVNNKHLPDKFIYSRPGNICHTNKEIQYLLFPLFLCFHIAADVGFLNLSTNDELKASADHNLRPIIVPRDLNAMPWYSGYAECINSGKSQYNEDQAGNYRILFFSMNGQITLFVVVKCFNGR